MSQPITYNQVNQHEPVLKQTVEMAPNAKPSMAITATTTATIGNQQIGAAPAHQTMNDDDADNQNCFVRLAVTLECDDCNCLDCTLKTKGIVACLCLPCVCLGLSGHVFVGQGVKYGIQGGICCPLSND